MSNMSQLSEAQTRLYLAFLQSLSLDDPSLKVSIHRDLALFPSHQILGYTGRRNFGSYLE